MSAGSVVHARRSSLPRLMPRRLRGTSASLRLGVGILIALGALSVIVSLIGPAPNHQELANGLQPPRLGAHPLGTDQLGRDVLAWTAGGIRTGLLISVGVVALTATVGIVVGLVAGYVGGAADAILMRLVDLQLAVPGLLIFITASSVLVHTSALTLIVLLSIVGWVPYARLVRTAILSERERGYVAAARLAGASRLRVLRLYLLPATASVTLVLASLNAGFVLLAESALSFLGMGIQPPRASLGYMIAQGQADLVGAWWVVVMPGIAIVLLVLAFNVIGDGLRDGRTDDAELLARGGGR